MRQIVLVTFLDRRIKMCLVNQENVTLLYFGFFSASENELSWLKENLVCAKQNLDIWFQKFSIFISVFIIHYKSQQKSVISIKLFEAKNNTHLGHLGFYIYCINEQLLYIHCAAEYEWTYNRFINIVGHPIC